MPETTGQSTPSKACDHCRIRKVRCNRDSPCSNCKRAKVQCTTSPRVARPRRRRAVLSSEYEGKLEILDRRLDQVGRFMDKLAANNAPRPMASDAESPSPSLPGHSAHSPCSTDLPITDTDQTSRREIQSGSQPYAGRRTASPEHSDERVVEGLSSLTANSTFAIDFLHRVAGADRERGHDFETRELLDRLRQIVNAVKSNRLSPAQLLPLAPPPSAARTGQNGCTMPPIQAAVAVIRQAREQGNIAFLFLGEFLHPLSLSDLCLKVYFSQDYSDAEYIILSVALYYLFDDKDLGSTHQQPPDDSCDRYRLLCQTNLETALSGIPLVFRANYDMVLALVLGAIYAVEISKPALAWTYVGAAQQTSYSLGLHTRSKGAGGSDVPNKMGLLFWIIYVLEKSLCLRLGRCSTILDIEVTVPLPASSITSNDPTMSYFRESVRFASLAGRTYEKLYSAHALSYPDETRRQRVLELSRELHDIRTKTCDAITYWRRSGVDKSRQKLIDFISASDEVLGLSMQTLILRAAPAQPDFTTTFTDECIGSARAALESHQACVLALDKGKSPLLSSYLHWTILFSPFIPFIVLFCHVIETGNVEDLDRMHAFVISLESARERSSAIAKHYDLFEVFHNVAMLYTELKSASTPTQPEQAEHRVEMGTYLSELGFQPQVGAAPARDRIRDGAGGSGQLAASTAYHPVTQPQEVPGSHNGAEQAAPLANWYTVSQQMLGWLDNDELPFILGAEL